MGLNRTFSGESRGLSSVMGVALIFGMVIAASMVIVSVGAVSLSESQSTVSMESAVTSMEELNAEITEVATGSEDRSSVSLSSLSEGDLSVEDTGWMNVTVGNESGPNQTTGEMTLGQISYTQDEQTVAIQGGGVWRSNVGSDGAVAVSEPAFEYRYRGGNPTLTLSAIDVSGVEIDGDTANIQQASAPTQDLTDVNPIQPGEQVNITVQSEYYEAWGEMFEENGAEDIHFDHDSRTVSLILEGPERSAGTDGTIVAPHGTGIGTNNLNIDSYDSSEGPYASSRAEDAFVMTEDTKELSVNSDVYGDMHTNQSLDITNDPVNIYGELRIGEDLTLDHGHLHGDVHVNGELSNVEGHIYDDLHVAEGGPIGYGADLAGDIYSGDSLYIEGSSIDGDIYVENDITLTQSTVDGNIYSTGDVELSQTTVTGTVEAEGDIMGDWGTNEIGNDANATGINDKVTVSGDENPSASVDVDFAPNVAEPQLPSPDPVDPVISDKESELQSGIHNPPIDGETLTEEAYYFDNFNPSDDVTFDTSSNDIEVYAEDIDSIQHDINITGDGRVELYIDDSLDLTNDGRMGVEGALQDATQLQVYISSDKSFEMNSNTEFIGQIYGAGDTDSAELKLTNHATFYGAMSGGLNELSANADIHFDEALLNMGDDGGSSEGGDSGTIQYIQISSSNLE